MKRYLRLVTFLLAVAFLTQLAAGQDTGVRDTLYFGDVGKAYGYPGNIFKIPIYITTDQDITGLDMGMEFDMAGACPDWDSISECTSIFGEGPYLDLGRWLDSSNINGVCPDTLGLAGVALVHDLPAGKYKYCDVWFTGGTIGQQVTVDTASVSVSWHTGFVPPGGTYYQPILVAGTLNIVAPPIEFTTVVTDNIEGVAGETIWFDGAALPYCVGVTVVLDSIVNAFTGSHVSPLPSTTGTNPVTVQWETVSTQYGEWVAWFTATDLYSNGVEFSAEITLHYGGDPCEEERGDPNCDGAIDIDDVVYLVAFIFQGGPPPGCNKGE